MKKLLVICGPTASGKTALAVECARRLNGEVISADSMLVYKRCNIGAAKPTESEMRGVKHHMIDVAEPTEEFSVSDYERLALPIVYRLSDEGKTPVICGGTGFYIKSILFKSGFGMAAGNEELRQKYQKIAEENGNEYLHSLLAEVDPESAQKLHYNDVKRVIRALEIFYLTGKKKSAQQDNEEPRFPYLSYMFAFERAKLYERINVRVDKMLSEGLIGEVEGLMADGITDKNQCMQGIGYKEVYGGLMRGASLNEISDEIKQNTRNYAKRQLTFFKKLKNTVGLPPQEITAAADKIIEEYERTD